MVGWREDFYADFSTIRCPLERFDNREVGLSMYLVPAAVPRCLQLALHPAPPGERPGGNDDGLAVGVVERVLGEPSLDQVDQAPVAEGVPYAGGDVVAPHALGPL